MTSAPARARPMAAARPKSPNPMTTHFMALRIQVRRGFV
jgi:hypothetical protein